jgi:hypothetical protein
MAAATMMSSKMVRPAVLGRTPALPFRAASRSAVRPASRVQAVQSFEGVQVVLLTLSELRHSPACGQHAAQLR